MNIHPASLKLVKSDFYSPQGEEEFKKMAEKYRAIVTATPERAKQELIALGVLNSDGSKSINYFPDGK